MSYLYGTLSGTTERTTRGHKNVPVKATVATHERRLEVTLRHDPNGLRDIFEVSFEHLGSGRKSTVLRIDVDHHGVARIGASEYAYPMKAAS